jgi:hypothetical protein
VRGRDAAAAIAVWALFNAALAGMLVGFRHHWFQLADYGLAVVGVVAIAVLALRGRDPRVRWVPEASAGAVLLAVAVVLLAVSPGAGLWAAFVGGGAMVVAVVVLVRERAG